MEENKKNEQNEENEVEIYTLQDEDGKEYEFEVIATCEKNGTEYYAMIPVDEAEKESEYYEYTILKAVMEDGEKTLISIDDDDEFDEIADYFDDALADEVDYDAGKQEEKKNGKK